jgi:5-oxoprolinase (ATP-hydrolysing)
MTDPEVLEWRFPVRVDSFSIRRGSGGRGAHDGGDGIRREVTFLEAMKMTLLTSHRRTDPYGLAGGAAGARGRNLVRRHDGRIQELAGNDETDMAPGDAFIMETPGGGAYGGTTAG